MSLILVIGENGTGKSTAIHTLNPKETFLIKIISKVLPFRGSNKLYRTEGKSINCYCNDNWQMVIKALQRAAQLNFKNIVLDDFQYVMANEFMKRAYEVGYSKYTEIGCHAWEIIKTAMDLKDDINIFILSHSEETDHGKFKLKTIGKLCDEKIVLEGMFTQEFYSTIKEGEYVFQTRNLGQGGAKNPMDMFKEDFIPNDLQFIVDTMEAYYNEDIDDKEIEKNKTSTNKKGDKKDD
jgi:hypothetical protein